MNWIKSHRILIATLLALLIVSAPARAAVYVQCPEDTDGDGVPDIDIPNVSCMHLSSGDGFTMMADGRPMYIFSFADITNIPQDMAMAEGMLLANNPAPTISVNEGDDFYLSLTNTGMVVRPDLFDTHTLHWHGFPEAASIFDGVPHSSIAINMGATLTYYYKVPGPGTYMYHCHVEATEHMQMGMLGNLYVHPIQNETGAPPDVPIAQLGGNSDPAAPLGYTYNDGDASTAYDVEYPIQMGSFDSAFHDASETVQPLPFALMFDDYPLLNGRGYPDTIVPGALPPVDHPLARQDIQPQAVSSLITADAGDTVLLRISNLNITRFHTLATLGIQMTVVGKDAKHLRSADGPDMYYTTNSVTLGGGEAVDVLLDIPPTAAGETYFLYTTNLNYLSNGDEDFGGMMTEIQVNP